MTTDPQPKRTGTPRRRLKCSTCGQSVAVSPADLLRFTRNGWPKCCGQVMELVIDTEPPPKDGR